MGGVGNTRHWRRQWWKQSLRGSEHTSRGVRTRFLSILHRNRFWTSASGPLGGRGQGCLGGGGNRTFYIWGGGEDEVSGGIGRRGVDRREGENAPRSDDGTGMRSGVQSINLI